MDEGDCGAPELSRVFRGFGEAPPIPATHSESVEILRRQ